MTQHDELALDVARAVIRAGDRLGLFRDRIHCWSTVASTNDVAARLAREGAPEGTVVVARGQTAGRGRRGRAWFSPYGAGLYVSAVFRPATWSVPGRAGRSPDSLLTLAAGVALAEAIRSATAVPVQIKWPNDIVIGMPPGAPASGDEHVGRKVAGILAEATSTGAAVEHVILGFGINVAMRTFPPDIASRATSLEAVSGRPIEQTALLIEVLASLAGCYGHLARGTTAPILERWSALAPTASGTLVEWDVLGGVRSGWTAGLDSDGALLVETASGVERVVAGTVRWGAEFGM
jgi:BirA family transcriptional regulator, biotin operon repressor / biotin---[acetyl-CoA-carboxylase] ligase